MTDKCVCRGNATPPPFPATKPRTDVPLMHCERHEPSMNRSCTCRILCKFHMNGACQYGNKCRFSHDMTDLPNMVSAMPSTCRGCCVFKHQLVK